MGKTCQSAEKAQVFKESSLGEDERLQPQRGRKEKGADNDGDYRLSLNLEIKFFEEESSVLPLLSAPFVSLHPLSWPIISAFKSPSGGEGPERGGGREHGRRERGETSDGEGRGALPCFCFSESKGSPQAPLMCSSPFLL